MFNELFLFFFIVVVQSTHDFSFFFFSSVAYAEEIPFTKPAPIDEMELKKQQKKK